MKNIITLQKDSNGDIYYQEITSKGLDYIANMEKEHRYWGDFKKIKMEELEEILDKEI